MKMCKNCMWVYHMVAHNPIAPCENCKDYDKWQTMKQTNADYITSSIDAFAKFMSEHAVCHEFKCPAKRSYIREDGCHDDCTMTEENCIEAWRIWLNSGVENVER